MAVLIEEEGQVVPGHADWPHVPCSKRVAGSVTVKLGTMMAAGMPNGDGTELTFQVPDPLPDPAASTVEATISGPGQTELVRTFPVEQPRIRSAWREDGALGLTADGLSVTNPDFVPRVIINGRTATAVEHLQNEDYHVTLPGTIDETRRLQLMAFDDLGRKTAEYALAAAAS